VQIPFHQNPLFVHGGARMKPIPRVQNPDSGPHQGCRRGCDQPASQPASPHGLCCFSQSLPTTHAIPCHQWEPPGHTNPGSRPLHRAPPLTDRWRAQPFWLRFPLAKPPRADWDIRVRPGNDKPFSVGRASLRPTCGPAGRARWVPRPPPRARMA
jgi:hypothetical protein